MAGQAFFWGNVMRASLRPLFLFSMLVLALIAVSPVRAQQERLLCVHGVVAPDHLNVRAAPDFNAPVVARYPADACGVQVVGRCAAGWCEMALNGVGGWVYTKNIAVYELPRDHPSTARLPVRPQPEPEEQGSTDPALCVARVARGDTLRIRTGPSVNYDEIGGIPPGACGVERMGACRGPWCQIQWRGRTGWVNTYFLD